MFPFMPVPMDVAQQAFVQIRAEERGRTGNDVTAAETEVNPQLRYDVIWQGGQSHFVAIYQPRFVYTHVFDRRLPDPRVVSWDAIDLLDCNPARTVCNLRDPNADPISALQNGGLGFEMVRRRFRLSAYQFAAYGPVTTTSLLVQPAWNGEGTPPDPNPIIPSTIAARFTLLFAQTQVFVPIRITPRVSLTPGFFYNAFGGADSSSRRAMAMTSGPAASLALEIAATRADRFISTLGVGMIDIAFEGDRTGASITRAEANQQWRHYWSSTISTGVLGGGMLAGDNINGYAAYSVAQIDLLYDNYGRLLLAPGAPPQGAPAGRGNHLQVGFVAKAQPWIDLFSGELEQRAVGSIAVNDTFDRYTVRGQISAARVFNTPRSVAEYAIFQAEGGFRMRFMPTFFADVGVRFGYQDFDNAIRFNQLTQTTLFGGLTFAPLPARF